MIFVSLIVKVRIFLCQGAPAKNVFILSPLKCPLHIPLVFFNVVSNQYIAAQQTVGPRENSFSFGQKRLIISYKENLKIILKYWHKSIRG